MIKNKVFKVCSLYTLLKGAFGLPRVGWCLAEFGSPSLQDVKENDIFLMTVQTLSGIEYLLTRINCKQLFHLLKMKQSFRHSAPFGGKRGTFRS